MNDKSNENPFKSRLTSAVFIALFLGMSQFASASCDLQIVSAGPCLANGSDGIPQVGDYYGLKVTFNVVGAPSNAFRIKYIIANVTNYYENPAWTKANSGWWNYFIFSVPLDDTMPWSVTLDPDQISGNTDFSNNTASGSFTPVLPSAAVNLYSPNYICGSESDMISFQPGVFFYDLWVTYGAPTSHGAQNIIAAPGPTNGVPVTSLPYEVPVFEILRTNIPAGTFQDGQSFTAELFSMRVNPNLLRQVTWAQMQAMGPEWQQWTLPDADCESTNPLIVNFVQQSLPTNYQAVLSPYDTARTLHRAVEKSLVYETPAPYGDAVGSLEAGASDCTGFASLLTASLRAVGIPARRISGFWPGTNQSHWRVEFHLALTNTAWIVADADEGNAEDPTGTYAYAFGYVPDANTFFAVDVGDNHTLPYGNIDSLSVPTVNWYVSASPTFEYSYNAVLSVSGLPYIQNIALMGTNVVISGTNGLAGAQYNVLTCTNLNLPLNQWTVLPTNSFNAGSFSITNTVNPSAPQNYFILRLP